MAEYAEYKSFEFTGSLDSSILFLRELDTLELITDREEVDLTLRVRRNTSRGRMSIPEKD